MKATKKSIQKDKEQSTEYRIYVRPDDESILAERVIKLLLESFIAKEISIPTEE